MGPGSRFLGLTRMQYQDLHIVFMVPFLVAGVLHIVWSGRTILGYLRVRPSVPRLRAVAIALALAVTVLLMAGTLVRLGPFESFIGWSRSLSHGGGPQGMGYGPGGPWGGFRQPWAVPSPTGEPVDYGPVAPD